MEPTPQQQFNAIKPLILGFIYEILREAGVGNGAGGLALHDLNGPYHSGTLDVSKVPDALATDGSRPLTGNLSVSDTIEIDGRDISADGAVLDATVANVIAVSASLAAHAGATAAAAHSSVGAHNHSDPASGGDLTQYATVANTRPAHTANHLGSPALADSYAWTNTHSFSTEVTFNGTVEMNQPITVDDVTIFGDLTPATTDSSSIGSSTKLFNKAYISEIEATLFAQNTAFAVGGWLVLAKNEGTLAAEALAAHTSIDFGQAMTAGDFVVMRAFGLVEYLAIGSLVSGTRYNVTRSLDPSGANDWPQGTVYLVLGQSGNGRIELNANDTPRISLIIQGTTYNSQKEMIRLGDLNGGWGYGSAKQGLAIGLYESGKNNIVLDEDGNFKIRRFSTDILRFNATDAFIDNPLTVGTSGGLLLASGTFAAPTTGWKIYNNGSGPGVFEGYLSGVLQTTLNSSGQIYAGSKLKLAADGLSIVAPTAGYESASAIKFLSPSDGTTVYGYVNYVQSPALGGIMRANVNSGDAGHIHLTTDGAASAAGQYNSIELIVNKGGTQRARLDLFTATTTTPYDRIEMSAQAIIMAALLRWGGTSFPANPLDNDLYYRTDRDILYFYNHATTKWLSVQNNPAPMVDVRALSGYTVGSYFVAGSESVAAIFDIQCRQYNVYITSNMFVGAGATNDGTRYWQYRLEVSKNETGSAVDLIAAANTSSLGTNGSVDAVGTATEFAANAKGGRVLLYLRPFGTTPTPISARPSIWYRWVG